MTQESPLLLCHECRQPIDEFPPPVRVSGEPFCRECGPDRVASTYGE